MGGHVCRRSCWADLNRDFFLGDHRHTDDEGARQKSVDYTQEKISTWMLKELGLVTLLTTRRERSAGQIVNRVRSSTGRVQDGFQGSSPTFFRLA